MNILDTEHFVLIFEAIPQQPQYIIITATAALVSILLYSISLTLSGYKKFGWALLISLLLTLITFAGAFAYFYTFPYLMTGFVALFGFLAGTTLLVNCLLTLVFKRKSNAWDGIVGASLGHVLFLTVLLSVGILYYYPMQ